MRNLKEYKVAITHGGSFHTDDVMCTALVKYFNPDIKVKRVLEFNREPKNDEIVYDIGLGQFDHHQEDCELNDEGNRYSAFGLLWEAYGREYLKHEGFDDIEEAFDLFKSNYIYKIDKGDNYGYVGIQGFSENNILIRLNPKWFENDSPEAFDKSFDEAVEIGRMFLESWTRQIRLLMHRG